MTSFLLQLKPIGTYFPPGTQERIILLFSGAVFLMCLKTYIIFLFRLDSLRSLSLSSQINLFLDLWLFFLLSSLAGLYFLKCKPQKEVTVNQVTFKISIRYR